MITLRTKAEIAAMHAAGRLVAACHRELRGLVRPGVTTLELDQFVEEYLAAHGARAEQKGYHGYPFATCASVNDEICHGFPTRRRLRAGDLVTIDFVANLDGWLADSAWSYPVGRVSAAAERLLAVTHKALYLGIAQAQVGNRVGDIGHAIQSYVEDQGFSVVRDFTGHDIGRTIHGGLQVPHYGLPDRGPRLAEGMVITIEPMVNAGDWMMKMDHNGWTARTLDGRLSAQYEHTLAIMADGPVILTEQ